LNEGDRARKQKQPEEHDDKYPELQGETDNHVHELAS
jgi:hypothetical protein